MHVQNEASKVLIADDSASSRELMRFILQRFGCQVIEARDGEEALRQAVVSSPDLIILDLYMPVMDGFAVAASLRQMPCFSSIPILALSAALSEVSTARLKESGFSLWLQKPIAPAVLREHIMSLMCPEQPYDALTQ